jgi:hypothetical protein
MTSEQRLDRLERIAKLFVRAGLRARRTLREQSEKIDIIINNQIKHDERFAQLNEYLEQSYKDLSQAHNQLSQSQTELSLSMNELAKAQTHTSGRLDALIEIVRRDRNGGSN